MPPTTPDPALLTDDTVATLLAAQGFDAPPADDLREIAETARAMLEQALAWAPFPTFSTWICRA